MCGLRIRTREDTKFRTKNDGVFREIFFLFCETSQYRVGHKFVHSFFRRRRRPIGGQAGASDSLGACLGYVGDIDTIYTAVALSVWTWQAIQENIQNKLRAGLAATAILPRRGTSKRFDFK
jgi:hypothetical protein